jgi:ubiquitin C-terminal hydrolase
VALVSPPGAFTVRDRSALAVEPVTSQVTPALLRLRTTRIVPPMRASEMAEAFFNETRYDSDNMWKCALRRVALLSAPPNLIVHLKRFKMKGKYIETDNAEVLLDDELDLSRFVVGGGDIVRYQLVGVVCHSGTVGFGHYTAYGKRAGDWY